MGFFSSLFGGSTSSDNDNDSGSTTTLTCGSCGEDVDENDFVNGQCEDCCSDYTGTTYCCGMIYEDGEDTCKSCGEPL